MNKRTRAYNPGKFSKTWEKVLYAVFYWIARLALRVRKL